MILEFDYIDKVFPILLKDDTVTFALIKSAIFCMKNHKESDFFCGSNSGYAEYNNEPETFLAKIYYDTLYKLKIKVLKGSMLLDLKDNQVKSLDTNLLIYGSDVFGEDILKPYLLEVDNNNELYISEDFEPLDRIAETIKDQFNYELDTWLYVIV